MQVAIVMYVALALYALYSLLPGPESKLLLLDLHCFNSPERLKISRDKMMEMACTRGVSVPIER